jgi:hypothetical protein
MYSSAMRVILLAGDWLLRLSPLSTYHEACRLHDLCRLLLLLAHSGREDGHVIGNRNRVVSNDVTIGTYDIVACVYVHVHSFCGKIQTLLI